MLALAALACALSAAAAEPRSAVDARLELDGLFELGRSSHPEGFVAPAAAFAARYAAAVPRADVPGTGASFFARAQVLMRLGPPPALDGLERVPDSAVAAAGGREAVTAWLERLRALHARPEAAAALSAEASELAPARAAFDALLSSRAFVAALERYAGLELPGEQTVLLSAFHPAGAIANVVAEQEDGTVRIASLLGGALAPEGLDFRTERVPGMMWHELGHGALDPLADLWSGRIAALKPADPKAVCYGEWRQCVREHVARAVMLRLLELRLGAEAAAEQRRFEAHGDFRWLEPMAEKLREYEKDRARWPTLADFYPELLSVLGPAGRAEDAAPFDPKAEPSAVAARALRLAQAALPKVRDTAVKRRLERALSARKAAEPVEGPRSRPAAQAEAAAGIAAFGAGKKDEALRRFDAALALDPGYAEAALSRATVLEALGRPGEAADAAAAAAAIARRRSFYQPRVLADAALSLARLRLAAGREADAKAALAEALEAAPKDWPGRREAEGLAARLKR